MKIVFTEQYFIDAREAIESSWVKIPEIDRWDNLVNKFFNAHGNTLFGVASTCELCQLSLRYVNTDIETRCDACPLFCRGPYEACIGVLEEAGSSKDKEGVMAVFEEALQDAKDYLNIQERNWREDEATR